MLARAVRSYLAVRRASGFRLKDAGRHLRTFAAYSDARRRHFIKTREAVDWARRGGSVVERARRLGHIIRCARYLHAEDPRHEIPAQIFGRERWPRRPPYLLTDEQICQLIELAAQSGYRTLRRQTYSTLFGLLSCTGLRVSEAIRLRYSDITQDGLLVRETKFHKSRLVALHPTARAALERYMGQRRPYAPFDDHVFISLRRKPLLITDVESAFRTVAHKMGLPVGRGQRHPTPHSLRHAFAVRALRSCPDGRDRITQHMLMLSTYLGHSKPAMTYWYLEAVPDLMRGIAERCEAHLAGGVP